MGHFRYIGEESVSAGAKVDFTDAPTWIIDPVDGTMNFVHSFPFTCVSIGEPVAERAARLRRNTRGRADVRGQRTLQKKKKCKAIDFLCQPNSSGC